MMIDDDDDFVPWEGGGAVMDFCGVRGDVVRLSTPRSDMLLLTLPAMQGQLLELAGRQTSHLLLPVRDCGRQSILWTLLLCPLYRPFGYFYVLS